MNTRSLLGISTLRDERCRAVKTVKSCKPCRTEPTTTCQSLCGGTCRLMLKTSIERPLITHSRRMLAIRARRRPRTALLGRR